jgi:aminomethyltransferase
MNDILRATPFHGRAAALNVANRWSSRNDFTLASDYGDILQEALAARARVVIADISWRWRIFAKGARAAELMSRLATRNAASLNSGEAFKALWLNDSFLLVSAATDANWFSSAASVLDVELLDTTEREGGVALIGPYAAAVLKAAGLEADVASLGFRKLFWRGLDITITRWGEHGGYEIWCAADDCYFVWDRLMRAGDAFGIKPAGLSAMDILDIEAGVPRPVRDYLPAKEGFIVDPTPELLALESLIDEKHLSFNGRAAWLENRGKSKTTLVGVEIDSETPAPFTVLKRNGTPVGQTLVSVSSPVLRRAIALAQVEKPNAVPGTGFTLTLPGSLERPESRVAAARVVALPFLNAPDSILP